MADKKKTTAAKRGANQLEFEKEKGESQERTMARLGLSPVFLNTATARLFAHGNTGELDITESISVMREKIDKVKAGDMAGLEATLIAQATALDAIFNELARRAALNMGEYIGAFESYMRLALKAQAQTVRTVEALAAIKNPPVVFAKQANISHGHQQVNNGTATPTRTGKIETEQTKLLSGETHATLDTSGTAATIGADQALETVGAINRP